MQPEDIIKQKEWWQLTDTEKQIVLPLTATESEYNLLRNILMVAAEESANVPEMSPAIYNHLQAQFKKKETKKFTLWYYVAASVIVAAIVLSWLLMKNQKDNNNQVVVQPGVENHKEQTDTIIYKPDTDLSVTSVNKKIISSPKGSAKKRSQPQQATWVTINTSIAKDKKMLALVTEVY